MNQSLFLKFNLILIMVMGSSFVGLELKSDRNNFRTVTLTGVVIDNNTLSPLKDVKFFSENEFIGKTNDIGFFTITLNRINSEGEIRFNLLVKKEGYKTFVQNEHWGDIENDNITASIYFALQKEGQNDFKSVSNLDLDFLSSSPNLEKIEQKVDLFKKSIIFDKNLKKLKMQSAKVFYEIDDIPYLVSETGWLKLKSGEDLISINGEEIVSAKNINSVLQRKKISSMSPIESNKAKFIIHTKG